MIHSHVLQNKQFLSKIINFVHRINEHVFPWDVIKSALVGFHVLSIDNTCIVLLLYANIEYQWNLLDCFH